MIEAIIKQFAGSTEAQGLLSSLTGNGLTPAQAQGALTATAEGAAQSLTQGGGGDLAGMLGGLMGGGGGGAASMLGGLMGGGGGGGGVAGMLGGLMGGGGAPAGLPAGLVDSVATFVAQKTGLAQEHAKMAVNVILPKLMDYAKSKMG